MKVVVLLVVAILTMGISSCQITPGMAEPSIYVCTIIDGQEMDCSHVYDPGKIKKINVMDAIGYQCVSPNAYAEMDTHHEVMHKELNRKK
jgi:hypothetical protein